ncbi:F-actin-capping protein subunit beta [Spiromyces aspiralis]|uniref:F-actin-capping protein subunit beta n=1 Tax=Spiromyces aspiralis TaxID=68401 RepID=A0ACC1HHA7_9FUNG|nr:F-actin-capping protein subunit beta [Spiromyces aspiralis]
MSDSEEQQLQQQLDCALDLMRRLPPQNVEQNLVSLLEIAPELTEDLLSSIDQPLKVRLDTRTGKEYLICDYNRDGDSYRSPWSNEYDPPLEDGTMPSSDLRKLEMSANYSFNTYKELYFNGGVSSVYLWDLEDGFAGVVLIKKESNESSRTKGSWDSIHVVEVIRKSRTAIYKLTSTVMLYTVTGGNKAGGIMNLSGSLSNQDERELPVENPNAHIANIGHMVEDAETKMRNKLEAVYFGKTRDILNELRSPDSLQLARQRNMLQSELLGQLRS